MIAEHDDVTLTCIDVLEVKSAMKALQITHTGSGARPPQRPLHVQMARRIELTLYGLVRGLNFHDNDVWDAMHVIDH